MTAFVWATVTAVSPLRVRLDGDSTALAFTPDSLVDPLSLAVGSRVRCEISERRIVIHGAADGQERQEFSLVAATKWSLTAGAENKMYVKSGVLTIFYSLTTTSAIGVFNNMFSIPGGYSLPTEAIVISGAYDQASGAIYSEIQAVGTVVRIVRSLASGRRIQGSMTWVIPN